MEVKSEQIESWLNTMCYAKKCVGYDSVIERAVTEMREAMKDPGVKAVAQQMQTIERIKEKLKDATPGPWIVGKYERGTTIATVCHVSEFSVGPEDERYDNHGACKDDADYIAACNPAAMSEVLAHIDNLEAEIDRLRKDAERMKEGLDAVEALIDHSSGVAGLHLNGDLASWRELRTGGRFETWLLAFDEAINGALKETP